MKIKRNELPKSNCTDQSIMCSLAKAINNNREGNYIDCMFTDQLVFLDYLCCLEKVGVISKKESKKNSQIVDLSNYICIRNPNRYFKSRNAFCKWLLENAVPLLALISNVAFTTIYKG